MDAITLLITEHDKVRKILGEIKDNQDDFEAQKTMFKKLRHDLIRHEKMEQQIWYPHFQSSEKLDDTVKHLIKEEKDASHEIQDLDHTGSQESWEEKFLKFKKDVEHHAHEEEQKLFPQVKKILSEEELKKIGKEMLEFKKAYD